MNYSLSGRNNSGHYNQFEEMPTSDNMSQYGGNRGNKFNKTANDVFGIGKDLFGAYSSYGGGGYGGLIGGAMNAGMSALNGGSWKEDVPQSFFGIDDHKDSDVMQTLKGAGKGAMMGAPFGPIGMAVGALLGTGASFLDDI